MEPKNPIIIDGVDVSGCRYNYISITKNICCYAESERHVCMRKCKDFPNCYYKQLERKEKECERLKWYLKEIRDDELKTLDIELDEYETHCIDTEYTNIINLVEKALEEISPEDCN